MIKGTIRSIGVTESYLQHNPERGLKLAQCSLRFIAAIWELASSGLYASEDGYW